MQAVFCIAGLCVGVGVGGGGGRRQNLSKPWFIGAWFEGGGLYAFKIIELLLKNSPYSTYLSYASVKFVHSEKEYITQIFGLA